MRRSAFANEVIRELTGKPATLHGRRAFQAQFQTEGGDADNNPANTTLKTKKSRDLPGNTAHVQEYETPDEGIAATVKTFRGKDHGYEKIIRLLKQNAPATQICIAIIESDWGTGEAVDEDGDYLLLDVLADIKHARSPNTLAQLEAKQIPS